MSEAVVIGSGAAGSVAAWELARRGWSVTVLERGRNLRPGFGKRPSGELGTRYGSDEIKAPAPVRLPRPAARALHDPHPVRGGAGRRAVRDRARSASSARRSAARRSTTTRSSRASGSRTSRQLSDLGPVDGAQVADWPIGYDDLAPYYDVVERRVGRPGRPRRRCPARTLEQSPRRRDFVMPPNPIAYAATLLAEGAAAHGLHGLPAARGGQLRAATTAARPATRAGCARASAARSTPAATRSSRGSTRRSAPAACGSSPRAFVHRIETDRNGRPGDRVRYVDRRRTAARTVCRRRRGPRRQPDQHRAPAADVRAARAHPDGLGNRSDQVGRNMMFHNFTLAAAFYDERHPPAARAVATRSSSTTWSARSPGRRSRRSACPTSRAGSCRSAARLPLIRRGDAARGPRRLRPAAQAADEGRAAARPHRRLAARPRGPAAGRQPGRPRPEVRDYLGLPAGPDHLQPAPAREGGGDAARGAAARRCTRLAPGAIGRRRSSRTRSSATASPTPRTSPAPPGWAPTPTTLGLRPGRPAARGRQRLRRGRLDLPDLPRLQPDQHDHGQRAADRPRDAS